MGRVKIEYVTHRWNPIAMLCTPASAGCANCWHRAMSKRIAGNWTMPGPRRAAAKGGTPFIDAKKLLEPLKTKKPARFAVQFMGDLFHESVWDEWLVRIFAVMAVCHRHTFQVLTKRPKRMMEWVNDRENYDRVIEAANPIRKFIEAGISWPLRNVWIGTSVENRKVLDRIDHLRQTPAVVRFLSIEPLLEDLGEINLKGISWVIVGGESGPRARPMDPAWARSLRDQCKAAGVPFFFKQMSKKAPIPKDLMVREFPEPL